MDTPTLLVATVLLVAAIAALLAALSTRRPRAAESTTSGTLPGDTDIEVQSGNTARLHVPPQAPVVPRLDHEHVEKTVPMGQAMAALAASSDETMVAPPSSAQLFAATPPAVATPPAAPTALPRFEDLEDEEVEPTRLGKLGVQPTQVEVIVVDPAAAVDEATSPGTFFVLASCAQTDRGMRRKRNEDSVLMLRDDDVYVVADGMGGHQGGEIASQLAVEAIGNAFQSHVFPGPAHEQLPLRASELARAVDAANTAIREREAAEPHLKGMGTTVCAARFARNKRRFYIAHVGDSRMYRLRKGELAQLTSDHTLGQIGVEGKQAAYLSRAVGPWDQVMVDVLLGEPIPGDVFLLCSDGLTKMLSHDELYEILTAEEASPDAMVNGFIAKANSNGGRDNITVIVMKVLSPPEKSALAAN